MSSPTPPSSEMRLYDQAHRRLYVNAAERERFLAVSVGLDPLARSFCNVLAFTGCRISEALALNTDAIQMDTGVISFRTLKRRFILHVREVPIPHDLVELLKSTHPLNSPDQSQALYVASRERLNRSTAYRWVKACMKEADISGSQACPKGLRHGFGIHAIRTGVPLNLVQKWMGHAAMSTTAIYTNASGREERDIAARMWKSVK